MPRRKKTEITPAATEVKTEVVTEAVEETVAETSAPVVAEKPVQKQTSRKAANAKTTKTKAVSNSATVPKETVKIQNLST